MILILHIIGTNDRKLISTPIQALNNEFDEIRVVITSIFVELFKTGRHTLHKFAKGRRNSKLSIT